MMSDTPTEILTEEASMGAKAEALAKQFEAKVHEATGVIEKISDTDWKKVTSAEKWPVGVVAHHLASAHSGIAGIIKAVATGTAKGDMTMDQLNAMNAKHAKETIVIKTIVLTVIATVIATNAHAVDFGSEKSVAQWRNSYAEVGSVEREVYRIGYSSGVIDNAWLLWNCPHTITVGDLEAFLAYTAEPHWPMGIAVMKFFFNHGCHRYTDAEIAEIRRDR